MSSKVRSSQRVGKREDTDRRAVTPRLGAGTKLKNAAGKPSNKASAPYAKVAQSDPKQPPAGRNKYINNSKLADFYGESSQNPVFFSEDKANAKKIDLTKRGRSGVSPGKRENASEIKQKFGTAGASARPKLFSEELEEFLVSRGVESTLAASLAPAISYLLPEEFNEMEEGPKVAPKLYADRPEGMTPPQFLLAYYSDWMGRLSRKRLAELDLPMLHAIDRWTQRRADDPDLARISILTKSEVLDRARLPLASFGRSEFFRARSSERRGLTPSS